MDLQIGRRLKAGGFRPVRAIIILGITGVTLVVLVTMSAQVSSERKGVATNVAALQRNAEADAFVSSMAYIKNERVGAAGYPSIDFMPQLQKYNGLSASAPWFSRFSALGHDGVVTLKDRSAPKDVCVAVMGPRSYAMLTVAGDAVEIRGGDGSVSTSVQACVDGVDIVVTVH